jgi:hypothetical protein
MVLAHDRRGLLFVIFILLQSLARPFAAFFRFPHPFSSLPGRFGVIGAFPHVLHCPTQTLSQWSRVIHAIPSTFSLHPDAVAGNPRRSIPSRMARNNSRGTATSAIWKTNCRAWQDDLRRDPDQFLTRRRQRPVPHPSRQHGLPQKVAQVVSQHEQLQPDCPQGRDRTAGSV